MTNIAKEMIAQQERLAAKRKTYDNHCTEVARYVLPRMDSFTEGGHIPGDKRTQYIHDSVAPAALERFAAAVESVITPRSSRWHGLSHPDEEVQDDQEAQEWFDEVTALLFRLRYSSRANFASQRHEGYMSLGAFGGSVLIVEERPGAGFLYKSSHLSEHFYMENIHGNIDANWRKYKLTARQAREKFPESQLPPAMERALENEPEKDFDFLHCVIPNAERKPHMLGAQGMAFSSFHVSFEGSVLLGTGGFRTFPFIIDRYVTTPGEIYGRSVAMTALPEIKMVNEMRKTDLRARHKAVDPPILAANEATLRKFAAKPNAMNYGALDANGNPLVKAFHNDSRIDVSNDAIEQSHKIINDIFLVTLFQILVESPQMTATEVLERAQEKGALLSPTMGRQQEGLGRQIDREIDIVAAHGYFDDDGPLPIPQSIKRARERYPDDYVVQYTSPLSRMQNSSEALGAERIVQSITPLLGIDPTLWDNIDGDEYIDILKESYGTPARLMRSKEEKAALREGRERQQQATTAIAAGTEVAGAMKDIASAQAMQ